MATQARQNDNSDDKKFEGIIDLLRQALRPIDEVRKWPDLGARLQGLIDDIKDRSL